MTVTWDEIEEVAKPMFNTWTSGGDLAWGKEAWSHLVKAGLAQEVSFIGRTLVCLRLLTLARIYDEFSAANWDESRNLSFTELADGLWIEDLALGVAATEAGVEFGAFTDAKEVREACLAGAVDALRNELFQCLSAAYGGAEKLYFRLSATRAGGDQYRFGEPDDMEPTGTNLDALDYVKRGFRRL